MKSPVLTKPTFGLRGVALLAVGLTATLLSTAKGQTTNEPAPSVSTTDSTNASPATPPPLPTSDSFADGLTAEAIITKAKATYAALQSYSDDGTSTAQMGSFTSTTHFNIRLQRPSLYRIDWQGSGFASTGVVWSDGTGDFLQFAGRQGQKQQSRELAIGGATGISGGSAANIPGTFFNQAWGGQLNGAQQRQKDETVGGIDCYVLERTLKRTDRSFSTTLWIGKQDSLIRQIKTVTSGAPSLPPLDDASLKKVLADQNKPVTPEAMDALRKQLTAAQEIAKGMLKAGNVQFLESHSDIVTTKTFAPADFKPEAK